MSEVKTSMMLKQQVTTAAAWTRDSLSDDDGILRLDNTCLAEIEKFVALRRDNPLPTTVLDPDDFAFTACRGLMARAKQCLDDGVGFVIIDQLPLASLSRAEAVDIYWLLATMVARPVAQKWDGQMIYDVADSGQKPGNGVRPDITNIEQNFHTDNSYNLCPPDYVALLCLQKAMTGGINRVVSFYAAHNVMLDRDPDLLARLYRPFYFDRQREHAPDDVMVTHHPLFTYDGGRLQARLSHRQVINGQELAGEPLDAESRAALDALETIMNEPAMHREFVFEPGQIQIINNAALGHMRTGFQDWPEAERKRHLVRLWLRDHGRTYYNG